MASAPVSRIFATPHSTNDHTGSKRKLAALFAAVAVAAAGCGGGGGSAGTTFPANAGQSPSPSPAAAQPAPSPAPAPVATPPADGPADVIVGSQQVQNQCAAPRAGLDPATGKAFLDKPGSLAAEKSYVRSWIDETYLWFDEIPATIRADAYPTPQAFFADLRTPARTASGNAKDKFHFIYDTSVWFALSSQGVEAGYGFELALLNARPPRDIRIAYTDPNTPAAAAGLARGAKVLEVDGADAVNGASADKLNAGLFPNGSGESHTLKVQDADGTVRSVTLTSANVTKTPVQNVKAIDTPTGKVGYLQFNDHIATSEAQLIAAMTQLKAANVQDLVLDMRYNGGGLLAIASELAFMVASPAATTGKTFETLRFNRKNPFGLSADEAATPFYNSSLGFSGPRGQILPQLGLQRVTVLTGPGTCSASEAVINGLRGVDVQVTTVGETTCGKPYGFIPQDNCGTTYFAIQFQGVNQKNFGDYSDGFAPTCQVSDDFSRLLGDVRERRLAAALALRDGGSCPAQTQALPVLQSAVALAGDALVLKKSPLRSERILADVRNLGR